MHMMELGTGARPLRQSIASYLPWQGPR